MFCNVVVVVEELVMLDVLLLNGKRIMKYSEEAPTKLVRSFK